jgi:hypothetical protein
MDDAARKKAGVRFPFSSDIQKILSLQGKFCGLLFDQLGPASAIKIGEISQGRAHQIHATDFWLGRRYSDIRSADFI